MKLGMKLGMKTPDFSNRGFSFFSGFDVYGQPLAKEF
jgi:hypothetical protein